MRIGKDLYEKNWDDGNRDRISSIWDIAFIHWEERQIKWEEDLRRRFGLKSIMVSQLLVKSNQVFRSNLSIVRINIPDSMNCCHFAIITLSTGDWERAINIEISSTLRNHILNQIHILLVKSILQFKIWYNFSEFSKLFFLFFGKALTFTFLLLIS